tara:strand:+ start:1293 stop:1439 length:147 start_codon:yes stop_codon:yes gene_type:complete
MDRLVEATDHFAVTTNSIVPVRSTVTPEVSEWTPSISALLFSSSVREA